MKLKLSPDGIEAGSTMTVGDGSAAETGAAVGDKKPKRAAKPKAAKKPAKSKATPQELPNMKGKGVEKLNIPSLNKTGDAWRDCIAARQQESEPERAAKAAHRENLHKHREKLPVNKDGYPFYEHNGHIDTLEEKLVTKSVDETPEND